MAALSARALRKQVFGLLTKESFEKSLESLLEIPAKSLIGPLFSHFYHADERTRWRAVSGMGAVVDRMAETGNMEAARVVMRRLMWNLNDESGGIGWGSPEAMGDITARNGKLAKEFHQILTSYAWEEGNYLEHEMLQRGLLWGIGRLSHERPELVGYARPYLIPFLSSPDPYHRGLSAWALHPIADDAIIRLIKPLAGDNETFRFYVDYRVETRTVAQMARNTLNPPKNYPRP